MIEALYQGITQHCHREFDVIALDLPWKYDDKARQRIGAERHYTTLTFKELCALPVDRIGAENSALWMWTTGPMLEQALKLIRVYGYRYVNWGVVWRKVSKEGKPMMGPGHWVRGNEELMLFAHKGKMTRFDKSVRTTLDAQRGKHSEKPAQAYKNIERLYGDVKRIELFAREPREGWTTWGNEVD